jgi:hypothetical protein
MSYLVRCVGAMSGEPLGPAFVDINNFKSFNDTLGGGDRVLQTIADQPMMRKAWARWAGPAETSS